MKTIRILTIILFFSLLLAPMATFNREEDAISEIDNRTLTPNPFSADTRDTEDAADPETDDTRSLSTDTLTISYASLPGSAGEHLTHDYTVRQTPSSSATRLSGDLTQDIEHYVNDRIGFRDDMILGYTVLNDRLFGKMVHPSYVYGKDGYVFGQGLWVDKPYTDYYEHFADMVVAIQNYCEARDVPFLFAFNPAKPAVLTEYLPEGMHYDRSWVDSFLAALDARGVHYVDTTPVLRERTEAGESVFNQKYNANHWNYLGAYYGTRDMMEALQKRIPSVHVTTPEELDVTEVLQTSLMVSKFPIHETEPSISIKDSSVEWVTEEYADELYRNPTYHTFEYAVNEERRKEGAPRALVFQGSYMNGFGYTFLSNAFSEYIYVHDYQNVMDFPYYFSVFQPDCVVFEVAEYTFSDEYFSSDAMQAMELNPVLDSVPDTEVQTVQADVTVEQGDALTTICWDCDIDADYAWLRLGETEYDMYHTEDGFAVTLATEDYLRAVH